MRKAEPKPQSVVPLDVVQQVIEKEAAGKTDGEALDLLLQRLRNNATGITSYIYSLEDDLACFASHGCLFAIHNATSPVASNVCVCMCVCVCFRSGYGVALKEIITFRALPF